MKKKLIIGAIIGAMLALTACGNYNGKSEAVVEADTEKDIVETKPEPDHGIETDKVEETIDLVMNDENAISMEAYQRFIDSGESLYFDMYDMEGFEKDRHILLRSF